MSATTILNIMSNELSDNPWLQIPAEEYEGHMSSRSVGQLVALADIFGEIYSALKPARVLVLGAATGNGFEHIDPEITSRVVALDINPEYLELARARHATRLTGLELVPNDVAYATFDEGSFDLVLAALFLEYVDVESCLRKTAKWIAPGGYLEVILQLPGPEKSSVSDTRFQSLKLLEGSMRLIPTIELQTMARVVGLQSTGSRRVGLPGGKAFHVESFVRQ